MTEIESQRNLGGRPSKFVRSKVKLFLRLVARGMPFNHASNAVGWTYASFANYRRDNPRFEEAVQRALARGIDSRLKVIERCLGSNDESIRLRSATWYLEHVPGAAEHFSKSRLEISGSVVAPVILLTLPKKDSCGDLIEVEQSEPKLLEANNNGN